MLAEHLRRSAPACFLLLALGKADVAVAQSPVSKGAEAILQGTIVTDVQSRSFAIIVVNGESLLARLGSEIPALGKLVSVEPKRVVIARASGTFEYLLGGTANAVAAPAPRPAAATADATADATIDDTVPVAVTPPDRSYMNADGDQTPYPLIE